MFKLIFLTLISFYSFSSWSLCDGAVQNFSYPEPVNTTTFNIEAKVFRPVVPAGSKFPVVFIFPPVVGETPLDGALAFNLCSQGIGAYILNLQLTPAPPAEQVQDLNTHEDGLIRAEFSLAILLEILQTDPQVSGNYGIVGASLGGIISSYLMGIEPRLKAGVLLAAGGNIAEILTESEQESVKRLREARFVAFNLANDDDYENLVRPFITREPLVVASNIVPGTVLMFIPKFDEDVPTKNQRELASAIQGERAIELNNTHVPGIIEASTVFQDEIIKFLRERL